MDTSDSTRLKTESIKFMLPILIDPPAIMWESIMEFPKAWCMDITSAALSFGVIPSTSIIDFAFATKFLSLNMTPFGVPVVPEV